MAFKKVFKDPLTSSTNGSFTGNLSDPQSTVCSMICGTPVLSDGGVRKPMQNTLLLSSLLMRNIFAPVFLCSKIIPSEFSSGICFTCRSRYASRALTDSIWLSISECPFCCALGYSCNRIAPHFVLPRLRSAPLTFGIPTCLAIPFARSSWKLLVRMPTRIVISSSGGRR